MIDYNDPETYECHSLSPNGDKPTLSYLWWLKQQPDPQLAWDSCPFGGVLLDCILSTQDEPVLKEIARRAGIEMFPGAPTWWFLSNARIPADIYRSVVPIAPV